MEPGEAGIVVGCVLRLGPHQPSASDRDEVRVCRVELLESTLTLAVDEELVSNIINVSVSTASKQVDNDPASPRSRVSTLFCMIMLQRRSFHFVWIVPPCSQQRTNLRVYDKLYNQPKAYTTSSQ